MLVCIDIVYQGVCKRYLATASIKAFNFRVVKPSNPSLFLWSEFASVAVTAWAVLLCAQPCPKLEGFGLQPKAIHMTKRFIK